MIDPNNAFEVESGLQVNDSGPFYTGGPSAPMGLDLPVRTMYVQTLTDSFLIWTKFGTGVNDWTVRDDMLSRSEYADNVYVPANKTKIMRKPVFNCDLVVDGEVYIL